MSLQDTARRFFVPGDHIITADLPCGVKSAVIEDSEGVVFVFSPDVPTPERMTLAVRERLALAERQAIALGRAPAPYVVSAGAAAAFFTVVGSVAVLWQIGSAVMDQLFG